MTSPNPADNEHFYWFFRNIGRSGKRDEDAGSWGLGKWVFPDASKRARLHRRYPPQLR